MKNVCVITGGGSGMGLEAAKFMSKDKIIVISGRTAAKLKKAVEDLKALSFEAYAHFVDTSDRQSVRRLAQYAASLGEIKNGAALLLTFLPVRLILCLTLPFRKKNITSRKRMKRNLLRIF